MSKLFQGWMSSINTRSIQYSWKWWMFEVKFGFHFVVKIDSWPHPVIYFGVSLHVASFWFLLQDSKVKFMIGFGLLVFFLYHLYSLFVSRSFLITISCSKLLKVTSFNFTNFKKVLMILDTCQCDGAAISCYGSPIGK